MIHKITDSLIIFVIVLIIFFGANQACKHNGSGAMGDPNISDAPEPVIRIIGQTEGPTPLLVELDGSESYDPMNSPITFTWHFSDGAIKSGVSIEHLFNESGRYTVILAVTTNDGRSGFSEPIVFYAYGLANTPWPKFAHDERNSGVSENPGPMMYGDELGSNTATARIWRSGNSTDSVTAICIGFYSMVVYTQGRWLRARTASGEFLWENEYESKITSWPAVMHDGSIVFGTDFCWMHRVDPFGINIWSTHAGYVQNEDVVLESAVNIDHDGTIYVGGYLRSDAIPDESRGRLFALTPNGSIKWVNNIPYSPYVSPVPVIGIDGTIIVNGPVGSRFTPAGEFLNEFVAEGAQNNQLLLGPASVSTTGLITFTNPYLPTFYPEGSFFRQLNFPPSHIEDWPEGRVKFGRMQAPIIDSTSVNLVYNELMNVSYIMSWSNIDEVSLVELKADYYWGGFSAFEYAGASLDSEGRIYVSFSGFQVAGQINQSETYPYTQRDFLWFYHKYNENMTAPVIGENGWLYAGSGPDILAIGY